MTIQFFNSSIERFIESLQKPTFAKAIRMFNLLERFGHQLGMPHSKKIDTDLFELRIRGQQEVRILYTFSDGAAVVLHGFFKKSQQIPMKELAIAKSRLRTLDRK